MKATKWVCIFDDKNVHQLSANEYRRRFGKVRPPIGAFVRLFRLQHCERINPYGSEDCRESRQECRRAYEEVCRDTIINAKDRSHVIPLFAEIALSRGLDRAERPRYAPRAPEGIDEGWGVRRTLARPQRIGTMFGSIDARSREGRTKDGKESTIR